MEKMCVNSSETELAYDAAIPLLDVYLEEMKSLSRKDIRTQFIALLTIVKIW
jgi:hypothetical protein